MRDQLPCRSSARFSTGFRLLWTACVSALLVSVPAHARDSLEDILREGVRIILGGQNGSAQGAGSQTRDARQHSDDYYIDYRIKRRLNDNDQSSVAQATRRALDTGQPQRWRNRRAGITVLVSVSAVSQYDDFDYSKDDRYDRDERHYSTYPDGQYQRSESRWFDDDIDQTSPTNAQVPPLLHVDDWYRVRERASVRKGPGRRFDRVASFDDDDYVHVVGVVGASRDRDRQRNVWVFVDDGGSGIGFINASRLTTYRNDQTDLIDLAGGTRADGYGHQSTSTPIQRQCRSLTQRLVTSRIDESYTSTWCLQDDNSWESVQ